MAKSLTKKNTTKKTTAKNTETTTTVVTDDYVEDKEQLTSNLSETVSKAVAETIVQLNSIQKSSSNTTKEYSPEDTIPCRSVTEGGLFLGGTKSEILYRWSGYGDVQEVEFQDLRALLSKNSEYLFRPAFIIDDEYLLSLPKWSKLNDLYEQMFETEDLDRLFSLPNNDFKHAIQSVPAKFKYTIITAAGSRIANGELDSLTKIKALDEVFGTDLVATLVK